MENYDAINDIERDFPADERIDVKLFVPKEEQVQEIKKYLCTLCPHIREEGLTLECRPRKYGNRMYFVRYYDVLIETFAMSETQKEYDVVISFEQKLRISNSTLILNQAREVWGLEKRARRIHSFISAFLKQEGIDRKMECYVNNTSADSVEIIYNEYGVQIGYCREYGYFDILGITEEEKKVLEELVEFC